jgi:uncharacterized membrane protein
MLILAFLLKIYILGLWIYLIVLNYDNIRIGLYDYLEVPITFTCILGGIGLALKLPIFSKKFWQLYSFTILILTTYLTVHSIQYEYWPFSYWRLMRSLPFIPLLVCLFWYGYGSRKIWETKNEV